jgi:hypothetical protein
MHNVIHEALVTRQNILLPLLHIKLGIMKQIVKVGILILLLCITLEKYILV